MKAMGGWIGWRGAVALGGLLVALGVAGPAAAQSGGGDAQLLWGGDFRDESVGYATEDGALATLTLEHFGGWVLGDQFFFVDVITGSFEAGADRSYRMYSEWMPRLSLSRATGRSVSLGMIRDVLLVGEVHAGSGGYAAGLIGPGVDLAVPGFAMLSAAVQYRNDAFNPGTWQVTGAWSVPIDVGVELALAGFFDVVGDTGFGTTVMTQPQLLLELGSLTKSARRDVQLGVEWYLHHDGATWQSVPQALVRWAW